ncbi:hypothetical protein WN943_021167 [Citrus x changshan-huyou]
MIILIGEAKSGGGKSCERAKEYPYSSSTGAVAAEMHDISSIALEAPIYLHALQPRPSFVAFISQNVIGRGSLRPDENDVSSFSGSAGGPSN